MRSMVSPAWRDLITLLSGRAPAQLVLQFTDACNAHCPQCGMRANAPYPRSRLSLDRGRDMISQAARAGIRSLSLTGGEPFLYENDLLALIDHAGEVGIPYVRTGTNGFFLCDHQQPGFDARITAFARRLARTPLRNFWISLDSASADVHEAMRGLPGVVEGMRRALPLFHQQGLYPAANLGLNRNLPGEDEPADPARFEAWYEAGLHRFFDQVLRLGFTTVNFCYPMSEPDSADRQLNRYQATSTDRVVRFSDSERQAIYRALLRVIPQYRSRLQIFTPLSALYRLATQKPGYACRGGIDFFFADAKRGHVFPCGFRNDEDFGPLEGFEIPGNVPAECTRCDWECFRDPSEMLGPLLKWRQPIELWRQWKADMTFFRLWWADLGYHRACCWFDARRRPDTERLVKYSRLQPAAIG